MTTTTPIQPPGAAGGAAPIPAPAPLGNPPASHPTTAPLLTDVAPADGAPALHDPRPTLTDLPARRRWDTPAFVGLLLLTAVLFLWNLSASGYANSFYSAAAQAGSRSWSAFLWGASDAGGSITVDKPPAALWVMGLSVRVFGLSSWSILAPQALMGVASVALLYRTVRRHFGATAGLLAGAVLALTPVAALMFRFNNPDALLVLLLIASVWATLRAVDGPRTTRWMVLAGVLVGLAFLTKQLQAFLVLPGLAAVFLWAGPVPLLKRIRDGLLAVGAMVLSAGWWVALVELWPASSRPYIGGSQTNSFLELTFGYNGLGRITGSEVGSVGGGRGNTGGNWGATGITRMFGSEVGGQIAWLVPAALILAVAALWLLRRAPRTSGARAQVGAWLAWLLVTGLTFSFMAGIFHAYYTVALAPAVAALVGIGSVLLWRRRTTIAARTVLAGTTLLTAAWAWQLLGRSSTWLPWLRVAILATAVMGAVLLLAGPGLVGGRAGRRMTGVGAAVALAASLAGPTAYTLQTVSTAHAGSIVSAGPTVAGGGFGGGPGGTRGQFRGGQFPGATQGQPPLGAPGGTTGQLPGGQTGTGSTGAGTAAAPTQGFAGRAGGAGGMGGLLNGTTVSATLKTMLDAGASQYRWVAATTGSQNAASYQLATQQSVMPVGGFNGSDPSPTLAQFQAWVAAGQIHYYIGGSGFGRSNGGSDVAGQISTWVSSSFTVQTVDGVTVYDLTSPTSGSSSTTSSTGA
ncbi:MAG: glycosyl transferase [Cellulomonas sp. 73-145]|uniref:glycosyltransferase family 39 protein n=1 Tax=Cellulomonas sp. 73-145 TaxID=1895739 RepID=UPI000926A42E|nr:glycosyltransferase family 39 protein [Cellulomonas sp. 73-145]OJV60138.1 MAG: glycosyl transferase [Cellulomonas sp. 73-145]